MIRVLVAEDSSTARKLLVAILRGDPEFTVVGEAKNGLEAVELAKSLKPDLVTMDIQMPVLDGLEATRRIMIESATPIVIVSSLNPTDVTATMHSLNAGALAVLNKPEGPGSPGFEDNVRQFLSTLKAMSQVKIVRRWPSTPPYRSAEPPAPPVLPGRPVRVVAIAASTGGPAALRRLVADLPATFEPPILVVQHIAVGFARGMAEWLNTIGVVRVKVAEQGEALQSHTVYIAPDNLHLGVSGGNVILSSDPPVAGFRPSGTHLFRSVASAYGASAVGVIMTGMGQDGVKGLSELREAGGIVIAQDEATSEIYGMPGAAVAAGVTNLVLPLSEISGRLVSLAAREGAVRATDPSTEELLDRERKARVDAEAAQQRLQFLFQATSALFARPLTGASKLNTLAQLAVPHVADWCLVDIVDRGDALSRVAATHWDPARASAATHLVGRFGYDPAAPAGAGFAMRTGTAQIIDDLTESAGLVSASDSLRVLHGLGAKSVALVPLMGTQAPLGVVSFAFAESHRSYSSEELELLQDLCARAAWAVENAMLHEQTQRAVRARDDLLAVVSHDLRNPLSTISMAANLLRKGADDREKTLRNAERIGRAAGQMERLISDLLDLAAIESAHLRVEQSTWRVATLVAEAMELMGPLARERQLQLQAVVADGEANVMCDRDRTLQVFSNLIGNAVKFTPQGGTITVRVEPEERVVRVSVEDTGPGIPPEQLPHIFDRYWQARRSDRRGVGLGLSIANGIIAAQGGRIWVESTVGSGTAFRFTLRRAD